MKKKPLKKLKSKNKDNNPNFKRAFYKKRLFFILYKNIDIIIKQ